ncbi:hypothetical protein ScPMuIL_006438 [Solemya velum]
MTCQTEEEPLMSPSVGWMFLFSRPESFGLGTPVGPRSRAVTSDFSWLRASTTLSGSGRPVSSKISNKEIDDDLETLLDITGAHLPYDDTGQRTYERACRKLGVVPSSVCLRKLSNGKVIDLCNYGMEPKGVIAVSLAMVINCRVTTLNLQGNQLGRAGILYVQKMMSENETITDLVLSNNKLRTFGAQAIGAILKDNRVIRRLDISGNEFTDTDATFIAKPVEEHIGLRYLKLSHNSFGDVAGKAFGDLLAENSILQEMDLSWNHIRRKGAVSLAKGLKENAYLKHLDISWNGLEDVGAKTIAEALEGHCILQELDMSCNRISSVGFLHLMKSLERNDDLKVLKIARNQISEAAAMAALGLLKSFPDLELKELDMSEVTLGKVFLEKMREAQEIHPHLQIIYGYKDSFGKRIIKPKETIEKTLAVFKTFLQNSNLRIIDIFSRFDDDGSCVITRDEFKEGIKLAGMPISASQINCLFTALDTDGDGEIIFSKAPLNEDGRAY